MSRRHSPFGIDTTPGRRSASMRATTSSAPRSFHIRTKSPSATARAAASSGWTRTHASAALNSPNIELIVRCVAGVMSASGNSGPVSSSR